MTTGPSIGRRTFAMGVAACAASACVKDRDPTSEPAAPRHEIGPPGADPVVDAERFAALEGFCNGVQPVGPSEFANRIERARELCATEKASALIVEAGVSMQYFTGVGWGRSERPLLLVIPTKGDPLFVGPAFERARIEERAGEGVEVLVWQEHESPYGALKERLGARPRVALDPRMREFVAQGVRRVPGIRAVDGAAVVDGCRMVKSELELARLRRVNEATKAALAVAAGSITEGMSEPEIVHVVRDAQAAAGLDSIWVLALVAENAAYPHGTNKVRHLREGDMVLVDTGGALHGYRSDITRTWALGRPPDEHRRAWDTVLAAQESALAAIRAGQICGRADAAARAVVEAAGFGRDYERFTHRLGHGIGMEVHEAPYLVRDDHRVLAPGMTMSNEPGIYVPGEFGVRLEDIVAVTEASAEVFGPRPESLENPFGVA